MVARLRHCRVAAEWLRCHAAEPAALFVPAATRADIAGVPPLAEDAESGAGSVVIGDLGAEWTSVALNRAFRLLIANPAAVLIALGMARYWRAADGQRLDVGAFVAALEPATDRRADVLGKPSREFFEIALHAPHPTARGLLRSGDGHGRR